MFAGNDSASATALADLDEGDDGVEASDEGADEQEQGIWCLNLGRLPETKQRIAQIGPLCPPCQASLVGGIVSVPWVVSGCAESD